MKNDRRTFVKKAIAGATLASVGGMLPGMTAKSYGRIMGANDRILAASMGVVSRGHAVGTNFASQEQCEVIYSCDVDRRAAEKFAVPVNDIHGKIFPNRNKMPAARCWRQRR